MLVDVPVLKRLFLLGCENLRVISWGPYDSMKPLQLELLCIDTRPERAHGFTRPSLAQHKHSHYLQLHAIVADARLARSLSLLVSRYANQRGNENIYFNIHFTSSVEYVDGVQLETTSKDMVKPSIEQHHVHVRRYDDAFSKIGDIPLLIFPQPPTQELDRHIQISHGSHGLESDLAHFNGLGYLLTDHAESLHMHDALTSASMPAGFWERLRWCRLERCPNLGTVFPPYVLEWNTLQTIYASDLLKIDCIWSKNPVPRDPHFRNLQHLHLRSCPRLQFVLPVSFSSFQSLETLHIIHCGDLTHVFVLDTWCPEEVAAHGVSFPKLTTIHLHDLPKLQQICEAKMLTPALKNIRIRGCFGLRRLPTMATYEPGVSVTRPAVEMEKDVWDALEWDGLAAGHHPNLFEPPVHSRYYRRSRLLRGTVLR
ncbi:unnamed protein product [Urochloa decumbens]|uniref:Disease resistance protein At4g27190-like leucine-rich repeats domain-containing protein n=1 Tax=Urochloa decumbens TaxID=240449 RepID=A0ABC9CBS7_9POAL